MLFEQLLDLNHLNASSSGDTSDTGSGYRHFAIQFILCHTIYHTNGLFDFIHVGLLRALRHQLAAHSWNHRHDAVHRAHFIDSLILGTHVT